MSGERQPGTVSNEERGNAALIRAREIAASAHHLPTCPIVCGDAIPPEVDYCDCDYEERIALAALSHPVQPVIAEEVREALDFKAESAAFEAWATGRKLNMEQHPLHYLFLAAHTAIARDAWREAIAYARQALASSQGSLSTQASLSGATNADMRAFGASDAARDVENAILWCIEQAEGIMATTVAAACDGDPTGALQYVNSMASDIAINLQMAAQAIEARRAATAETGAVHESAVGTADAHNPSILTPGATHEEE